LSGFWSKDEILESTHSAWHESHGAQSVIYGILFVSALFTAGLTAFYTARAYFLTFHGAERFPPEAGHHPHEAPPIMAWPLRILAAFALFIGAAVGPTFLFGGYMYHALGLAEVEQEGFAIGLGLLSVTVVYAGIGLAWLMYI